MGLNGEQQKQENWMRSFLIISRCSSLVDYSELWHLPIRKNRGSARPEFIQTAVESIDSKVVSKCLTLPEKWGQLSGGSTGRDPPNLGVFCFPKSIGAKASFEFDRGL